MKIGFSNLFTTANRREPATGPKPQVAHKAPLMAPAATSDDAQSKRLKKQKEAFEALASLPSPKESAMQNASQKVGFLKQRLETLKAMMRFASPEQLKSMASELKSIARELGAAARQLGSGGGGGSAAGPSIAPTVNAAQGANGAAPVPSAENVESEAASAESDMKSANATLESAEADLAQETPNDEENTEEQERSEQSQAPGDVLAQNTLAPSTTQPTERTPSISASEHALRSILTDAKKEFQEAMSELKIYLRLEDKEARRELKQAEKDMDKVDGSLAKAETNALYSTLGQLLPTPTVDASAATGSIDIKV
ncbi:hypothetical protein [Vreelandella sp. EE7]